MEIIAHRGFWKKKVDQNTQASFKMAIEYGYGIETDIRDKNGQIVISHDLPRGKVLKLKDLLNLYVKKSSNSTLALNIKSDGLQTELVKLIRQYDIKNYFIFDMSIPENIKYLKTSLEIYARLSEYEKNYKNFNCKGLWIDQFNSDWVKPKKIIHLLKSKKKVCLVSSELHNRHKGQLWNMILENNINKYNNFMLCTDFPNKAKKYFNV